MDEYIRAKSAIFAHQGPGDRAVFNGDNEITRSLSGTAAPRRSRTSSMRCSTPPKVRAKDRIVSSVTSPWTAQMAAM